MRVSHAPTPAYRRVMIFIDGGYLRQTFEELYKRQDIKWAGLYKFLVAEMGFEAMRHPEVIRAYYYDAIVKAEDDLDTYKEQREYFSKIEELDVYEVRLARIKKVGKEGKRQKQKGADVRLAVDMLAKALQDHYDIAILLSGDDDLLDLVRAVKNLTDKRVYGAFFPNHISEDLRKSLDKKQPLTRELLNKHGIKT